MKECVVIIGGREHHLRDLFFEIFQKGMRAHASFENNEASMQVLFEYWLKEKLGES